MHKSKFKRYITIGLLVYVFELLVIIVSQRLGASNLVAVGLSFWLGMMLSFVLQKVIAFSDKRTHYRILVPQVGAFALLVFINFGFTLLITKLLSGIMPATITRSLALGITSLWNFYLYKTRIFKSGEGLVY